MTQNQLIELVRKQFPNSTVAEIRTHLNDALDEFNIKHNSYKHQSFFNKIKWWILNNYLKFKKAILNLLNFKNS